MTIYGEQKKIFKKSEKSHIFAQFQLCSEVNNNMKQIILYEDLLSF
jgi:hypothetical protein